MPKLAACLSIFIILGVLVIDQAIKIAVKTSMTLHQSIRITDWFYLLFTENRGMAFGWEWIDKLFLSSFRIVAVGVLVWYLVKIVRQQKPLGFILCIAFIIAGAAGNIIDSLFYGLCFTASSPWCVAEWVPLGQGYESILMGKVVDMFYFPLFSFDWPLWVPFVGGEHFVFFGPIFNFADAAISCGIAVLLLFYRNELTLDTKTKNDSNEALV